MREGIINGNGGGRNWRTLAEQINDFTISPGDLSAVLTWTLPPNDEYDPHFVTVQIVRKAGSAPVRPSDGTTVYKGSGVTYTDTGLTAGTTYYYRAFTINSQGDVQTAERIVNLKAVAMIFWEKWSCTSKDVYGAHYSGATTYGARVSLYDSYSVTASGEFELSGYVGKYYASDYNECKSEMQGKYFQDGRYVYRVTGGEHYYTPTGDGKYTLYVDEYSIVRNTVYSKGTTSYGTVSAIDSKAYPDDGYQDGYWYVRKR